MDLVRLASRMSRGRRQSMARKASARTVCVVAGTVKNSERGAASLKCTLERGGESRLSTTFKVRRVQFVSSLPAGGMEPIVRRLRRILRNPTGTGSMT